MCTIANAYKVILHCSEKQKCLPLAYVAWEDNYNKYKCIYHAACMLHGKYICVG